MNDFEPSDDAAKNEASEGRSAQTTTQYIPGEPHDLWIIPAGDREELIAKLAEEMATAWAWGERPLAEDFLRAHPSLKENPSAIMDLLYEEICLRRQHGAPLDTRDLVERFPGWKQEIDVLMRCALNLENPGAGRFPVVGETIGDFELAAELGRGALGRVFLATQSSLGDRPVAIKITPRGCREHLALARLQHTHIVPLLSVFEDPTRDVLVLCMPYFGGLTLAAILEKYADQPINRRSGQRILEFLDEARAHAAIALPPSRDPATPFLSRASYSQAISWIGACLAEALKYAHERGLVHLDLKPSNVLLTADRQPMLLDFHLAREPLHPGDPGTHLGGTPIYMSPEQKRAMASLRAGSVIGEQVDRRSDVFSLGLVLYEALGGPLNRKEPAYPAPLHQINSHVPMGLSDIISKCLSPLATDRYNDAGPLAADLWAHLNDMPLQGVANRSFAERWRKWRRRKPYVLSLIGMLFAVFLLAGAALTLMWNQAGRQIEEARSALLEGQKHIEVDQFEDAAHSLRRGLVLLEKIPASRELSDQLTKSLDDANRAKMAHELHQITDRLRMMYAADSLTAPELQRLEAHCSVFWDKRDDILKQLSAQQGKQGRQRVATDLLDLVILGSNRMFLRGRPAPDNKGREDALQMLEQAEALFGPNAVLYHEREKQAAALGKFDLAAAAARDAERCPPRTAWEFYALGRSLMLDGDFQAAEKELDRAVAMEPNGLWPNFYRGICSYRLGRFEDAALAFTVCTTLAPNNAGCFFNRGLAFVGLDRPDRALQDFERSLQLDPHLTEAASYRDFLSSGQP